MAVLFKKRAIPIEPFPKPSSHTPGDIITWDGKEWLVCHYDSSKKQVYLISKDIISYSTFGSNTTYAGSTLASVASDYQSNQMSADALAKCVDVTVNGVTAKVFIPSREQMEAESYPSQGFSWFSSDTNRKAKYNGSYDWYWTSSPYGSSGVWYVLDDGYLGSRIPGYSLGFRPCVCVQL